jgi:hypothetical protein
VHDATAAPVMLAAMDERLASVRLDAITLPSEAEQARLDSIAATAGLAVFAPIELERVEGSDALLVFTGSGPDHHTLWVRGAKHDVEFRGRRVCRVVFEGDPPTPRFLVKADEVIGNYPATLAEWQERQARRAAVIERSREEADAERERLRASAAAVTFDDLERDGVRLTLRRAAEVVVEAGGTIRVRDGALVVGLAPSAVLTLGQPSAALRASRRLYLAEEAVVAAAGKRGEIDPAKLPDRAILPSGKLAP